MRQFTISLPVLRKDIEPRRATVIRRRLPDPMSRIRKLRRAIPSQRALQQRNRTLAFGIAVALCIAGALAMLLAGCGPGAAVPVPTPPPPVVSAIQAVYVKNVVNT